MVNVKVNTLFGVDKFHSAFRFHYNEDFIFKGEAHDFWEVNYVNSGKILMTQDGKVYEMVAGDIIFHPPMAFHREQSADGTSPTGCTFSFHTTGRLPKELERGVFRLTDEEGDEVMRFADRLIDFINGRTSNEFEGQLLGCLLESLCIRLAEHNNPSRTLNSEGAIQYKNAVSVMHDAIYDNCTLEEIADRCSISVSYIKLLFKKYAGISPKAYYAGLRAKVAAEALRCGATCAEISERMNFSSPNYLSFFLKKHFGVTASELKNR